MIKKVEIILAGSGERRQGVIDHHTTPWDLLRQAKLDGYSLSRDGSSTALIPARQPLAPLVEDGDTLWATTNPVVGQSGGRATCHRPSSVVPYWQRSGWIREDKLYRGFYQTEYGQYAGEIEETVYDGTLVFIYNPPQCLRRNSCFRHIGSNWWNAHFEDSGVRVGEAILKIEAMINQN